MSEQKICPTCGTEYPLSERFCPRDGTALRGANPMADLVGEIVAERYHIIKKLGEGGMGTVYLAEHVKMGRKAALKVMNPGMAKDHDAIARFNREAANASRLNHPNVCGIYDFGETPEGMIYLAMEFIEGVSLTSLIEKSGALAAPRAASIIHQTADALQVAHDAGIVHRDLKPDNIMIAKARDGSDHVKVVDFGIAKASSSDAQKVTKTGLVVGTPEYMSPEQLAGDKLDGRSDIYSLALVAFNCLTGTLPFPSNSVQEAMIMRLTDKPKTLAEMKPDVQWTEGLQAVMDKALAREVAERYQSAAQFGRDLAKAVDEMPRNASLSAATQVIGAGGGGTGTGGGGTGAGGGAASSARTVAAPSVPMTRVAASPAGGGVAAPATPAPVTASAPSSSKMPMVAAAVVVLAVGGYFGGKALGWFGPAAVDAGTGATPPAGAKVDSGAGGTPNQGKVETPPNTPNQQPTGGNPVTPTSRGEQKQSDPGRGNSGSPPPVGDPAPSGPVPAAALQRIEDVVGSPTATKDQARAALLELDAIIPKVSGSLLGDAYYVQSMAYGVLEDGDRACAANRKARPLVTSPTKQRDLDTTHRQSCQ